MNITVKGDSKNNTINYNLSGKAQDALNYIFTCDGGKSVEELRNEIYEKYGERVNNELKKFAKLYNQV